MILITVSVSHLQSIFRDGDSNICLGGIVSEYASARVFHKVQLKTVQSLINSPDVKRNPAFSGWVTELEFLVHLRTAAEKKGKIKGEI